MRKEEEKERDGKKTDIKEEDNIFFLFIYHC
jgi:hypothetical protein